MNLNSMESRNNLETLPPPPIFRGENAPKASWESLSISHFRLISYFFFCCPGQPSATVK